MIDKPRDRNAPRAQIEQVAPVDQGASAEPARRCKTCACFFTVPDPTNKQRSQGVCRRNCVIMMTTQNRITGAAEMGFTFPPTLPDLVCFDGWRPIQTAPGTSWRQEQIGKMLAPALEAALKQAGVSGKLAGDIGRAMCDSAIAAGQFGIGEGKESE